MSAALTTLETLEDRIIELEAIREAATDFCASVERYGLSLETTTTLPIWRQTQVKLDLLNLMQLVSN